MFLAILVVFYLICSVVCYGYVFGYWQGKYEIIAAQDYWFDMTFAMLWALAGPLGLLTAYILSKRALFKYKRKFI